jgi:hypothetical protein
MRHGKGRHRTVFLIADDWSAFTSAAYTRSIGPASHQMALVGFRTFETYSVSCWPQRAQRRPREKIGFAWAKGSKESANFIHGGSAARGRWRTKRKLTENTLIWHASQGGEERPRPPVSSNEVGQRPVPNSQ